MSDRVFSGRDVAEALTLAAQALGVSAAKLRYFVLDAGSAGGLGLNPTPARVAVLLAGSVKAPTAPRRATSGSQAPAAGAGAETPGEGATPGAEIEDVVGALARAAGADVRAEVSATSEAMEVWLRGGDATSFLLQTPGVLEALDHLLHGMFAHRIAPLRLRVECEGHREHREERLRTEAHAVAAEVLRDGQPRTTGPLNSYERRIVHTALAEIEGVITYSVGDGADRRVTVAPEKASLGGEVH